MELDTTGLDTVELSVRKLDSMEVENTVFGTVGLDIADDIAELDPTELSTELEEAELETSVLDLIERDTTVLDTRELE